MNKILLALVSVAALAYMGCAKKKENVAVDPTPAPEAPAVEEAQAPAAEPEVAAPVVSAPAEDPLEAERRRLEEMMNRIMSEDVYFDYDKSDLTSPARDLLAQVGDALKREARFSVMVEGHTDERGTESYNMTLGNKRALKVVDYLKNYGVTSSRMKSVSYGEEKPKAEGESEEAYAQNRRAAFRVLLK